MFGLAITALLATPVVALFKNYFSRPALWALSLIFILVLISGANSTNTTDWLVWLRIKLPFLILPLAFAGLPGLTARQLVTVLYSFIVVLAISAIVVLGNYFLNYQAINQSFLSGSSIPMPFSHIRYTLMLAFAFFCCCYLLANKLWLANKNEKWLQWALAAFIFIALHLLIVRSSLLALYLGIFYSAGYIIVKQRRYAVGLAAIVFIAALPFVAYHTVPSFKNRVKFMLYDLEEYKAGHINNMSDGPRLLSIKIGWQLWQQNKWMGVGAGDLKTETYSIYQNHYPDIYEANRKLPHNQLVWIMAGSGLIGLLLFLIGFLTPLIAGKNCRHWPIMVLYLVVGSSLFTECTFEEQVGTAFYLIFLLLFINHYHGNK